MLPGDEHVTVSALPDFDRSVDESLLELESEDEDDTPATANMFVCLFVHLFVCLFVCFFVSLVVSLFLCSFVTISLFLYRYDSQLNLVAYNTAAPDSFNSSYSTDTPPINDNTPVVTSYSFTF